MYILWKLNKLFEEQPKSTNAQKSFVDFSSIIRDSYFLQYPTGNASFAKPDDKIFVPAIKSGKISDISEGKQTVFIDISENLICSGLENFICGHTPSGTPFFVCDNHNFVLEAWQLLKKQKPTLIHIDQHRDEAKIACKPNAKIYETRICDYIDFAIKNSWIQQEFLSFTESGDLHQLQKIPLDNKIVNIDIDIFDPECTILSMEEKVNIIAKTCKNASLITIATSPGFIKQNLAVQITHTILTHL